MKSQFISVMLGFFLKYLAKTPHSGNVCRRKTIWDILNIFSTVLFKFQPKFSSEASEYYALGNPKIRLKASNQSLSNPSLFYVPFIVKASRCPFSSLHINVNVCFLISKSLNKKSSQLCLALTVHFAPSCNVLSKVIYRACLPLNLTQFLYYLLGMFVSVLEAASLSSWLDGGFHSQCEAYRY